MVKRHTVAKGRGNQGDWAPSVSRKPDRAERHAIMAAILGMGGLGGLRGRMRRDPNASPIRTLSAAKRPDPIHPDRLVSTFARKQRQRSMQKRLPGYGYKRKTANES